MKTLIRRSIMFGAPLALAILMLTHPSNPLSDLSKGLWPWADWFITLHLLLVVLFGLLGYIVTLLVADLDGLAARVSRLAMGIFVVFYTVFLTVDGIVGGLLVRNAHSLPAPEQAVLLKRSR